jgi:tetratricopeptide (TPR) repeat protein
MATLREHTAPPQKSFRGDRPQYNYLRPKPHQSNMLSLVDLGYLPMPEALNTAEEYYNRAVDLGEAEDYQGAIADYTSAIKLDPDYAEAYFNRAYDRSEVKDYEGAIADYTKVIELAPDAAEAYFNRGMARAKLGDIEGAREDTNYAKNIA